MAENIMLNSVEASLFSVAVSAQRKPHSLCTYWCTEMQHYVLLRPRGLTICVRYVPRV